MRKKPSFNWRTSKVSPLLVIANKLREAANHTEKVASLYRECAEIADLCPPNLQIVLAEVFNKLSDVDKTVLLAEKTAQKERGY